MNPRFIRMALVGIWAIAIFLVAPSLRAAPLRVTTWDLQPSIVAGANGWTTNFQQSLIREAAESLKKLNPDVIVLQQMAGWDTCLQLAQALRPEVYQVTICSSFRDPQTKLLSRQVAILSKIRSYLSWSESWQASAESPAAPGGFAFAAFRVGDKNLGIFSVQLSEAASAATENGYSAAAQRAREESARQLLRQIAALQEWKTNRLEALVIAGDFNTTPDDSRLAREKTLASLEQSGFENAFTGLPLAERITLPRSARRPDATLDYIFTRDAGVMAAPLLTQTALSEHSGVTCDVDLTAPRGIVAAPQPARAELPPPASPAMLANGASRAGGQLNIWWLAGICIASLALFIIARKFFRRSRLDRPSTVLPGAKPQALVTFASPGADQVIIAPPAASAPFVQVELAGPAQTQAQAWARAEAGPATPQTSEAVRAGVIANLSRWLKQKFAQRLLSDRAQLLATQEAAALKVLAVDERLTRIERQIEQRNREYERRIDDLQQELLSAREENRELIRAKIALVKAEMEKARLKAAPARQHQQN